jgi:hypothetical protein
MLSQFTELFPDTSIISIFDCWFMPSSHEAAAPRTVQELSEMAHDSGISATATNLEATKGVLNMLGYFPLAIMKSM